MIADAFKVVLEAEVDDSKLNRAGSKMGESISRSMESNMKKSRDVSGSRSYRGLGGGDIASKFCECIKSHISKGLKRGTVDGDKKQDKVSGMVGLIGKKLGLNLKASNKMAAGIGKHLGLTTSTIGKLAVVIAVAYLVLNFIKDLINMLSPIIALLKLIMAVLTLTLYPIMMFFLTLFKPILYLLLKYLIIPFYQKVMPVIQKLGEWLGVKPEDSKAMEDMFITTPAMFVTPIIETIDLIQELATKAFEGILKSAKKFFNWLKPKWEGFKSLLIEKLQFIISWVSNTWSGITDFMESPLQNIINWVDSTWQNITGSTETPLQNIINWVDSTWQNIEENTKNPLQNIINWVDSTWQNITGSTETPLQNIINWVDSTWQNIEELITNPLKSVFDFISKIKLPSWLGKSRGGGGSGGGGSSGGGRDIFAGVSPDVLNVGSGTGATGEHRYRLAEGAIAMYPQNVKVAEREPEIIIPLRKLERVKLPSDMSKGNTTINFNIQKIEKDVDMNYLLDKLQTLLYSNNKRSGAF